MKDAGTTLERFSVEHELRVVSAHRTPPRCWSTRVVRRVAGLKCSSPEPAAPRTYRHAGLVNNAAGHWRTGGPRRLDGLDSLLSIVQMRAACRSRRWRSTALPTLHFWRYGFSPPPMSLSLINWSVTVSNLTPKPGRRTQIYQDFRIGDVACARASNSLHQLALVWSSSKRRPTWAF